MKIENAKLHREAALRPRCELCGGQRGLQTHHEPTWGSAGLETRLTLIRLCVGCHGWRHTGRFGYETAAKIIEAICRREKCSAADREAVVFLLKRAPKGADAWWFECQVAEACWSVQRVGLLNKTLTEAGR